MKTINDGGTEGRTITHEQWLLVRKLFLISAVIEAGTYKPDACSVD